VNEQVDIRWHQRYANFTRALLQLDRYSAQPEPNELEEQGLIHAFEYTYELAWNTLKDYLEYQGHLELMGARDTVQTAFKIGLIAEGEGWMDMAASRNLTSHAYDENTARTIVAAVRHTYVRLLLDLNTKLADVGRVDLPPLQLHHDPLHQSHA
jgi:nucleotidyltransferase substrate binding protein (TIGR01987 family)